MATAEQKSIEVVTKEPRVVLTMDMKEAEMLRDILGKFEEWGTTSSVYYALIDAGVESGGGRIDGRDHAPLPVPLTYTP